MTGARRLILILTLLPVVIPLGHGAGATLPPVAATELWSDPATWGGVTPAENEDVVIPAGKRVLLDVSPPALGGLTIDGALIFDDTDLALTVEWIVVTGNLRIGAREQPFRHRATITLTDNRPGEDVHGMGDRVIGQLGGSIEIHGAPSVANWVRLANTLDAGASTIVLDRKVDWNAGDEIVIASTDFDFEQAEVFAITDVSGDRLTLDRPARYMHWGVSQWFGGRLVDERAEVGLLSHNIVIGADATASETGFGGQLMSMAGSFSIENTELRRMGQAGELARYPIHFHMKGDAAGDVVRNVSIRDSFNRCITIHGTNNIRLEGNVAYETYGHCFFLEDGAETGNILIGNLGLSTRVVPEELRLLPTDKEPATYWITNPDNHLIGNVAAGSEVTGFWYALPEHPTGLSETPRNSANVWPRQTPLGTFENNVTHSNGFRGLTVDDGPRPDGDTEEASYTPRIDPTDEESPYATAVFTRLTAYKNRERAIWLRGTTLVVSQAVLADNGIGATFAAYEGYLADSVVIGETANLGSPGSADEPRGLRGRSLPQPWDPAFAIAGFEFYDGIVGVRDTQFGGFFPNRDRRAYALGFNRDNAFVLDPRSYGSGLTFIDGSNRVYTQPARQAFDGDKMRVFRDVDGSVTGQPGVAVVANQPLLHDDACERRPEWNAFICDGRYVTLVILSLSSEAAPGPVVVRQPGGEWVRLAGVGGMFDYVPVDFAMNLRPNSRYEIRARSLPDAVQIELRHALPGEWLLVTVAWDGAEPFVYQAGEWTAEGRLAAVDSIAELTDSDGDAWLYDRQRGTVTVKLQMSEGDTDATWDLCRNEDCR